MNSEKLLFSIGELDDSYILSAGKRLHRKHRSRRIVCIAAVTVLLLSSFVTAMAVNEDFREGVLSILHIEKTEEVQHSGAAEIGDVEASYVPLEEGMTIRNGLIYRDGAFCLCRNGELVELVTHTNSVDVDKNTFRYAYTVISGQLHALELSQEDMNLDPLLYAWNITPLRGSEHMAWLMLYRDDSVYPLLLDAVTGETTDILSGIELSDLDCAAWLLSPDNRYAVIRTDSDDRLVDVENKAVTVLQNCHESYFLSDGSLVCFESDGTGFDLIRRIIQTGEQTIILENAHYAWTTEDGSGYLSIDYYGGSGDHALWRSEDGSLTMLDLRDGSRLYLDGIRTGDGDKLWTLESADGTQVLVAVRNSGSFTKLGLLDCDSAILRIFDRTNELDLSGEEMLGFMADGSLGLIGLGKDGQWLYMYGFGETALIPDDDELVLIKDYIPDIFIDLKYASVDNFTGSVIYDSNEAYLRYGTVKKLAKVQNELRQQGYSLMIWDAFRPVEAQFKLWELCPDPIYVSDPNKGFSKHSRGNTVDACLVMADGSEVGMPSGFDDFSALADREYSDVSEIAAENALLLENVMSAHGFVGYYGEWWHYSDSEEYPVIQ